MLQKTLAGKKSFLIKLVTAYEIQTSMKMLNFYLAGDLRSSKILNRVPNCLFCSRVNLIPCFWSLRSTNIFLISTRMQKELRYDHHLLETLCSVWEYLYCFPKEKFKYRALHACFQCKKFLQTHITFYLWDSFRNAPSIFFCLINIKD